MSPRESPTQGQAAHPTDLEVGSEGTEFDAYPELGPIRVLAVDAVLYTFAIDAETESDLVVHLEQVVTAALVAAYAPIAEIARQASRVADGARAAQLAATARTAEVMAAQVAEVAAALHARGDAAAIRMAQAASDAADLMAASVTPGGERTAASAAAQVAAAVRDAAAANSREHAEAAAKVAQAAANAAVKVNISADVQNVSVELKVFEAAAAVRAIALDTCYQVAIDAAAIAAEQSLTKESTGQARQTSQARQTRVVC